MFSLLLIVRMQLGSAIHTKMNNVDIQVHGRFCGIIRLC